MLTFCENCNNEIINRFVYNNDKPELKDKKFCSHACMEKYYNAHKSSSSSGRGGSDFNWKDYQGWIIGGGIFLVLIIILGVVFSVRKRG